MYHKVERESRERIKSRKMFPNRGSSNHLRCSPKERYNALWGGVLDDCVGEEGIREEDASSLRCSEETQGEDPVGCASQRDAGLPSQARGAVDEGQAPFSRSAVSVAGTDLSRPHHSDSGIGVGGHAASVVGETQGGSAPVDGVDQKAVEFEFGRGASSFGHESGDDRPEAWALQEALEPQDLWREPAWPVAAPNDTDPDGILERAGAGMDGGGYSEPLRLVGFRDIRLYSQPSRPVFRMG